MKVRAQSPGVYKGKYRLEGIVFDLVKGDKPGRWMAPVDDEAKKYFEELRKESGKKVGAGPKPAGLPGAGPGTKVSKTVAEGAPAVPAPAPSGDSLDAPV